MLRLVSFGFSWLPFFLGMFVSGLITIFREKSLGSPPSVVRLLAIQRHGVGSWFSYMGKNNQGAMLWVELAQRSGRAHLSIEPIISECSCRRAHQAHNQSSELCLMFHTVFSIFPQGEPPSASYMYFFRAKPKSTPISGSRQASGLLIAGPPHCHMRAFREQHNRR